MCSQSGYILKVVLKCDIEVEGIASVSKPNAYEGSAAFEKNKQTHNQVTAVITNKINLQVSQNDLNTVAQTG